MKTVIKNSILSATINSLGAELSSLRKNDGTEFMWEGNPDYWGKHSPILFPIVGTLKNNSYTYLEKNYNLSRHGFARDMVFEIVEKKEDQVTFSLSSSEETIKVYPFEFELQVTYTLENNALKIAYKVINKGESAMPFSIGAHPAFALNDNFDSYAIEFANEESMEYYLLDADLVSNKTKTLRLQNRKFSFDYELFKDDALIFKKIESKSLTILHKNLPYVKVVYNDFPSLGLWTKMNAPFICIEPWQGYSDTVESSLDLFRKEGIQILSEKEVFNSVFSIEVF